ncbi:hypothetical protein E2C01_035669 [Portunus trituberculatus]|uniref:Uncharacterized protein n=1 Tax=Portunus trituberculatus TaxID=210409 RepID=A0A5B7F9T1_PORTR|nr:hypothetical protein [Portunus trituberculatus]
MEMDGGDPSAGEDGRRYKIQTGVRNARQQPLPASAWATPHSVLTCTAYVCLLIPSAHGVGLSLRPSNISFHSHRSALHPRL